jgi:cholesterol transport system auxiliary component
MNRFARRSVLAALALAPAGCSSLLSGAPPPNLYTLTPASDFPAGGKPVSWQLLVEVPQSVAALDSDRIALSRSATTVDYFADSAWTDRAPRLVQSLIVQSFENSGRIAAVGRDSLALRADYTLQLELRHFEADYGGGASPAAHVQIAAKLVKLPDRSIVAQRSFDAAVSAANQIPAVVGAFNDALHQVLRPLVDWTLAVAASVHGGAR